MSDLVGDNQINPNQPPHELVEDIPNKEENVEPNLIIEINNENNNKGNEIQNNNNNPNTPKKQNDDINNTNNDETNYPISDTNKKGLFSKFENPNQNIEINQENQEPSISKMTLDEKVLKSLKRDLFLIYNKLKHVITPRFSFHKIEELYNWDLRSPLIFF